MAPGYDDFLIYKPTGSLIELFSTDYGKITTLAPAGTWLPIPSQILAGNFARTFFNGGNQLLFYSASAGVGTFCTETKGAITSFHTQLDWQKTWTHIVPGIFGGTRGNDHFSDILFYDASAGHAEFYTINDDGGLSLLSQHDGWLTTWTHIIAGNFGSGSGNDDLLFYDATSGLGDFYSVNGGLGNVLSSNNGWRKTWTQIIPGDFGSKSGNTDLLFYDASGGAGEFYSVAKGALSDLLKSYTGWNSDWSQIVPGQFGGTADTDLLFYAADTGDVAIYTVDAGVINLIGSQDGLFAGGSLVVSGDFSSTAPQPSVPAAPSGLKTTGTQSNSVDLAWTDNLDDENGFTISYAGKRSNLSDHNGTQSAVANSQTATLGGLRSGYEYFISVVAFNDVGPSASSNVIQATPIPRLITVNRQGAAGSTVLLVSGTGFTPNAVVVINVTASLASQINFTETAQPNGDLNVQLNCPCVTGVVLTIMAWENSDQQATLANIVEITC